MPRPEVFQWVADLGSGMAASPSLEFYYQDAMRTIPLRQLFNTVGILPAPSPESDPAEFVIPDDGHTTMAVFHDDRMLSKVTKRELEAGDPAWRDRRGAPIAWMTDDLADRHFRLYPVPTAGASTAFSFVTGSPFGQDYPADAVAVVYSQVRDSLPTWMDLPLAFIILGHEFSRLSDHRNPQFAGACGSLGQMLMGLVA